MKKLCGLFIGICLIFGIFTSVQAYDDDMHYYLVYWMSKEIGFTDDHCALLALSNVETDINWNSSPMRDGDMMSQSADRARRYWHFPGAAKKIKGKYLYAPASQNNYYGLYNIVQAQSGRGKIKARQKVNPYYMGMSLHAYMDTYAHEGFESLLGHAVAGHDPDRPQWFKEKTEKMLDNVFTQLVNYGYTSNEVDKAHLDMIKGQKDNITARAWKIIDSYESVLDSPFLDQVKFDYLIQGGTYVGGKVKDGAKAAGEGIKKGAGKVKDGAKAAGEGIKKGAEEVADTAKKGAKKIGDTAKRFGRKIGGLFGRNSIAANSSEYLHNKVIAARAQVWLAELGENKKLTTTTQTTYFSVDTWKKQSLSLYQMPDSISYQALKDQGFEDLEIRLATNSSNIYPPKNYTLPKSLRLKNEFAIDFCRIADDMDSYDAADAVIYDIVKNKPHLILNPYYPKEYAQQIQCARALVSTRDGLEIIMHYIGNDDSGTSQMERLFMATKLIRELNWEISEIEPVVEHYLFSENKDTRLFAAWTAHMYGIGRTDELFNIFDVALNEERRSNHTDDIEKEARVIHFLPISEHYIELWKEFFQGGLPDEVAKAASALYFIGTYGALEPASNSDISSSSQEALMILQRGSAADSSGSFQEASDYWRTRSFEDIDEHIQNSPLDKAHIQELITILEDAIRNEAYPIIQAAATAAATYSTGDEVTIDLLKTLVKALDTKDMVIKAEVGYAIQEITGKSFDLTDTGLETIAESADTWIEERF